MPVGIRSFNLLGSSAVGTGVLDGPSAVIVGLSGGQSLLRIEN